MPQQFIAQLEQICRRRKGRRWLTATCLALAAMLLVGLVLMGLDRALGIADSLGRGLLSSLFVVLCVLIIRRWFLVVSESPVSPLQIAHEVEQRQPALRDVVANAWEFSQQADNDPTAGSEPLRRAIVLRAATAVDDIDWQQLIPRQPLRRAALALACVGIMIGALGWFLPQTMKIGLTRLINPLSLAEWPREHDLQFLDPPTLLAAGDDLVLQLRDTRASLPATITMHYRTRQQGHWYEESQTLAATTDPLEIRRTNVQKSWQYRATGADHQTMPWQSLEVVTAPRVEQLQVTVHPPAYTKLPTQLWEQGAAVYAGSALELQGRTDQPVTQVMLLGEQGRKFLAQLGADGKSFRIEHTDWRVESSEIFSLQLTMSTGLTTRAAAELVLDVVTDRPPQVRFVQPTNDLTVLPAANVPLVIEASDELALREIELVFRLSDRSSEGDQKLALWRATDEQSVQRQRVDFLWQLETLSLQPGSLIEIEAQATDAQPATGQTVRVLRLQVVSEDRLWHQILEQQSRLVESLAQLLREQRDLRGLTANWAELPEWSSARWASAGHAALFRQRQITDSLAGGQQSLLSQLNDLVRMIEQNDLVRPEATNRFQQAQALLQNLVDDPLVAVEQSLSEMVRQSQHLPESKKLRLWIAATAEHQEQVLAGLHSAIDLLMPGNVLGRLERKLAALETDQQALAKHCLVEITPQMFKAEETKADLPMALANAARRQRGLARRFAEFMFDMERAAQRLVEEEPTLAARVAATMTLAEQLRTQAAIQAAADQLARRRLGRAATLQRQVLGDFAKLRLRLAGQDAQGAAERFKGLQAAERKLQRLRRQVAALEQQLRQLNPNERQRELERLRRQREKLAAKAEAIARQLERLRLPDAAKPASEAASQLQRTQLDSETTKQARQQLDSAQRQLTTARRRQQVALARLQMTQLDAKLAGLLGRQQAMGKEIFRLGEIQKTSGQLSNAQEQSTQQLAIRQAELRSEVLVQADQLATLPVFAHLLKMASETMQHLEVRLGQTELDQSTQTLSELAVSQLTQLAKVLRQERKSLSASSRDKSGDKSGAGQGQGGDKPQEQTLQLALGQLQLLKSLQTTLQEKTQTLETQQAGGQTPTHVASELARQQQQLTELARQLVPESPDPPMTELFPNLEQELERSLDEIMLPRLPEENQP